MQHLFLLMANGRHKGLPIHVKGDLFMIGSSPICQVRSHKPKIAPRHCAIATRQDKAFVRDMGSGEATVLNNTVIPANAEWPLHKGDALIVGPFKFIVEFKETLLSQRDTEEWALKSLDNHASSAGPQVKDADDVMKLMSTEYFSAAQAASSILTSLDPERGILHGRLRVAMDKGVTVVRFNDIDLLDDAEVALVKQEIFEFLNPMNLRVLLDFKNVNRMSTAAANMVLELYHRLRQRRSSLALCRIRPELRSIFFTLNIKNVLFFLERTDAVNTRWDNVDTEAGGTGGGMQLVASNLEQAEAQGESREEAEEEEKSAEDTPPPEKELTDFEKAAAATGYVEDERGPSDIEEENRLLRNKFKAAKGVSVGHKAMEGSFDLDMDDPFIPKGQEKHSDFSSLLNLLPNSDPDMPTGQDPATTTVTTTTTTTTTGETGDRKATVKRRTVPALEELQRLTQEMRDAGRFVVFCPRGHRMVVQAQMVGQIGKCKKCQGQVLIPPIPDASLEILLQAEPESKKKDAPAPVIVNPDQMYRKWLTDVRFHKVQQNKLKLTPGSLLGDAPTADLGFSTEQMMLAVVFAGSGAFRTFREPKQKPVTRTALQNHLKMGKPVTELPVPEHHEFKPTEFGELRVVQPAPPGDESIFMDVPVFGPGRIAVRIPAPAGTIERWYVSFLLSQFRDFSVTLQEFYGIEKFGSGTGVPLEDEFTNSTCHYSTDTLRSVKHVEYYQADPAFALDNIGWKCGGCGLVISEASRRKEKIGGKSPSSVATARCPKCKQYFGNNPLWGLRG